jgi:hypothetical protein
MMAPLSRVPNAQKATFQDERINAQEGREYRQAYRAKLPPARQEYDFTLGIESQTVIMHPGNLIPTCDLRP